MYRPLSPLKANTKWWIWIITRQINAVFVILRQFHSGFSIEVF